MLAFLIIVCYNTYMKKYFKHKLTNLLNVNKLVTVHYFFFNKNFSYEGESHDFWEIVFADKEDIICTSNGRKINLKQGELLFHKPNDFHALASNGVTAPNVFIASFVCHSEAMKFFENKVVTLSRTQIKLIYSIVEEARKTFDIPCSDPNTRKMQLLKNPTLGGEQLIQNYIEILLIDILRTLTETKKGNNIFLQDTELENKLVKDVITILKNSIHTQISIDEICAKTSYSRAYVFKQFKAYVGKTIMEYFTELKIAEAKTLLKENQLSVKEISEKLGFDTPNYFSKTFKKLNGFTPTLYKKKIVD